MHFPSNHRNTKVITECGCQLCRMVISIYKTSSSVMIAGFASGALPSPYAVYKTLLYPVWMKKHSCCAMYNRKRSIMLSWKFAQKIDLGYLYTAVGERIMKLPFLIPSPFLKNNSRSGIICFGLRKSHMM